MAASASLRSAMLTNPKLRVAPVARSVITFASTIWPKDSKCARKSALVVSLLKLPTKSFIGMLGALRGACVSIWRERMVSSTDRTFPTISATVMNSEPVLGGALRFSMRRCAFPRAFWLRLSSRARFSKVLMSALPSGLPPECSGSILS
jgi:hypothetical protein